MELIRRFLFSFTFSLVTVFIFVTSCFFVFYEKVILPKEKETAAMILNLAKEQTTNIDSWDENKFLSILRTFKNKFFYVHFLGENKIYPSLQNNEGYCEADINNILSKNFKDKPQEFYFDTGSWPGKHKIYGSFTPDKKIQIIIVEKPQLAQTLAIWVVFLICGLLLWGLLVATGSYFYFKPLYEKFEIGFEKILPADQMKNSFSLNGINQLVHLNNVNRSKSYSAKKDQEYDELKKEIALAESIQANLFPEHVINSGKLSVVSVFGTATHCSGDWWFHKRVGDCDFILLADATGHGMPAALMTSAATAVVNTIDWTPEISVEAVLQRLNTGIYNVGKAKINMTAIGFKIDWINNKINAVSASHEFPYWYKKAENSAEALLVDQNCPRLGESEKSKFISTEYALSVGDVFILYTDGIKELFEAQQKRFSERQLLKKICASCEAEKSAVEISKDFKEILKQSAEIPTLPDDTTFIVCKINS